MKMRNMIAVVAAFVLVVSYGCGKKEEKPAEGQAPAGMPAGHPGGAPAPGGAPPEHAAVKPTKELKLSKEVMAKWTNVDITIIDKIAKKQSTMNVKVGDRVKIAGATMIKVVAFVPDYTIYEDHVGSKSNNPVNPAIMTEQYEGDKLVARGWIFKKEDFAMFNSFRSDKYDVKLLTPKGK